MNATTIMASVATATGLTVLNDLLNGRQSFQPVIGGFITGSLLLMLAFFSETLAGGISLVILLSSILMNATGILAKIQRSA